MLACLLHAITDLAAEESHSTTSQPIVFRRPWRGWKHTCAAMYCSDTNARWVGWPVRWVVARRSTYVSGHGAFRMNFLRSTICWGATERFRAVGRSWLEADLELDLLVEQRRRRAVAAPAHGLHVVVEGPVPAVGVIPVRALHLRRRRGIMSASWYHGILAFWHHGTMIAP